MNKGLFIEKQYENTCVSCCFFINQILVQNGFDCSVSYITRIFKQWGWSFKVFTCVNIHKFTIENIKYYFNYYMWAQKQLLSHLKFINESHFNADSMLLCFLLTFFRIDEQKSCGAKGG